MTSGLMQQLVLSVESVHNTTEVELAGLQRSTTYLVQIWASTIAGHGPSSPAVVIPALSSKVFSGQVISAITGGIVAVVFLFTVAAIIIAIIMKKYQPSMQFKQK